MSVCLHSHIAVYNICQNFGTQDFSITGSCALVLLVQVVGVFA